MEKRVSHAVAWHGVSRGEWFLLLGAFAYVAGTLGAQALSALPSFAAGSALERSSDIAASCGLVIAAWQATAHWSRTLVRRHWLLGATGMFAIWITETAAERLAAPYGIVIALWMLAAVLLVAALRPYAMRRSVVIALLSGIVVQMVAHADLAILAGIVRGPRIAHPLMAGFNSFGELCAVLAYIVAFLHAGGSGLDARSADVGRLARWRAGMRNARPRVCFSYIAQVHQIPHSLPIAVALAETHREFDVHVAGTARQLAFVRELLDARGIRAPLHFDALTRPLEAWLMVIGKKRMLRLNALYFSGFDALVVPERTSTCLRRLLPHTKLIGTEHGAGDREVTFSPEIARYDFLTVAGAKQARRLLALGYAHADRLASGIYAKLDWVGAAAPQRRRFDNGRPTVLYNPHFEEGLSSWHAQGRAVLDHFARSTRYNLIFAPHLRLFDPPTPARYRAFDRYRGLPHLHIDLGSARSVDMSYTADAGLYLGDVSSQVAEFLTRPRPCIFLNAQRLAWRGDPHFRFWELGPVIESADELDAALDTAFATHAQWLDAQRAYVADSFGDVRVGHSGARGAAAIVAYLRSAV